MKWTGETALITGASSGIGAATARKLAAAGLTVLLTARREDRLDALVDEMTSQGGQAAAFPADLAQESERTALIDRITAQHGSPSVLVNNAGFAWYGWYRKAPWEVIEKMVRVNVEAVAHLTRLLLAPMRERRRGMIINVGSIVGQLPNHGIAAYSASKAYVSAFSTALYREMYRSGVWVCEVRPGPVASEFFDTALAFENGGLVPGSRGAIPPERVAACIWTLMRHPHRVAYVPWWGALSPGLETFFGWAIDLIGPVLLRNKE